MASTANEIWEAISNHTVMLAGQAGRAVVTVDAGHRVAASGVYWKPSVIVTASHLVRRATEVNLLLHDGSTVKGTVAGCDSATDLAAIRLESAATLPILPTASGARVGELVLAVARSRRGELSTSSGVIGRIGGPWRSWRGGQIDRLLRPDVRLYPGQSGSALVNGHGELLGVNTAVLARESVITLPNETVDRVVNELLDRGHVARPYLGVAMQEVSLPQEWRTSAGLDHEQGLLVVHVAPDAPAKRAGISLSDVIIDADSQPVHGYRQFHDLLAQKHTGETLRVRLLRGGSAVEAEVALGDRPRR
jgi:S1-C subfamily serine protease